MPTPNDFREFVARGGDFRSDEGQQMVLAAIPEDLVEAADDPAVLKLLEDALILSVAPEVLGPLFREKVKLVVGSKPANALVEKGKDLGPANPGRNHPPFN